MNDGPTEVLARALWRAVNEPRQGYFALAEGLVAALAKAGYAIVPREPTEAMLEAGDAAIEDGNLGDGTYVSGIDDTWRAMVDASELLSRMAGRLAAGEGGYFDVDNDGAWRIDHPR